VSRPLRSSLRACSCWLLLVVLGLLGRGAQAQAQLQPPAQSSAPSRPELPAPEPPRDRAAPVISLLTFGPGDEAFAKFGHNALLVHDPTEQGESRDLVFNYGTFAFNSPLLALDFLKGNLRYWLSVSSLQRTVMAYRAANRSVFLRRLALSPEQAREVARFLYVNAEPENRYYRYDYYRDNCSTRVRDVIDRTLNGALAQASRGTTPFSYRDHTRRLTEGSPLLYFGLDLAMGPYIDRPLSEWEAMFLPAELDGKVLALPIEQAGKARPLVGATRTLFKATRTDPPATPSPAIWRFLAPGLALGAILYALGRVRSRWAGWGFAASTALLGLLAGLAGVLLIALWAFTDHQVTYDNQNVLLCPVWVLALPVLSWDLARAAPRRPRLVVGWFAAAGMSSLIALLIQLIAPASQHNGPALALLVPLWIGAALGAWERGGRPTFKHIVRARD
jgi:hypothetical protein